VAHETGRRIDDLIAQSHDPVQQATLLVLSKINISLDSNTVATERIAEELASHREDFQTHDREELRRMAWIRGAWWSIALMFAAFLAVVVFGINRHILDADTMRSELIELAMRIKILERDLK
jgi:hypothetical protein